MQSVLACHIGGFPVGLELLGGEFADRLEHREAWLIVMTIRPSEEALLS